MLRRRGADGGDGGHPGGAPRRGVGAGGSADLGEGGDYGRNGESIVPCASGVYGDGVPLGSGGAGKEEETGVGSGFLESGLGRGLYRCNGSGSLLGYLLCQGKKPG
jgi:hypothetical protein